MESNSEEKLSISSTISKKNLSKEARMILLMTKVRQTEQEFKQEQSNFINMMKEARKGIKEELKVLKQDIRVVKEEKLEPEPEIETDKSVDEVKNVIQDEVVLPEPEVINAEDETKPRVEKEEKPKKIIDPNLELLRNIKRRAAKKIDTGGGRGTSQSKNEIKPKQPDVKQKKLSSIRKVNDTPKNRKMVPLISKTDKKRSSKTS